MMADIANDIDIGKKPTAELPKPKKNDFIDLLESKPAKKEEAGDEDDFYAKIMADLANDIDIGKPPKVALPTV